MKGTILKTDEGWVVEIQSDIHVAGFGWLPSATYSLVIEDEREVWIGREVEVEVCEFDSKALIPIAVKIVEKDEWEAFHKQYESDLTAEGLINKFENRTHSQVQGGAAKVCALETADQVLAWIECLSDSIGYLQVKEHWTNLKKDLEAI